MKRLIFVAISLLFIQQAKAQFMMNSMAGMCPYQMQPASGAYNVSDEKDRQKQIEKKLKSRVKSIQKKISQIDKRLEDLQGDIDGRLQPEISAKAIEHMQLGGNASDYHRDCQAQIAASAGSTASNVPVDNAHVADANQGATAQSETNSNPANRFCEGPLAAAWSRNIQSGGKVNSGICRETSQLVVRPGSSAYTSKCTSAINRYASLYDARRDQEKLLAEAEKDLDDFEFGDYADSDTEGGRCIDCEKRRGSSGSQWMGLLGSVLQVGIPALSNYMTQKSWQKTYKAAHRYEVDNCSRLGYPSQMCYGQFSLANRYLGHFQQPYPSRMPGYMGNYGGMYGAVPGGIGPGAFGCTPGGFNPMGMPMTAMNNGWGGLFGNGMNGGYNPYAPGVLPGGSYGAPPFIGGQGPWGSAGLPQTGYYGSGLPAVLPYQANSPGYNPYLLNSEIGLLNSRLQAPGMMGGATGMPPAVLPYMSNSGISPIQTYPVGSALPAPVQLPPTGIGGNFYGTVGGNTMLGGGVMYGR